MSIELDIEINKSDDDNKETNAGDNIDHVFDFVCKYVLKSTRLKYDKWSKMMSSDEYRVSIESPVSN